MNNQTMRADSMSGAVAGGGVAEMVERGYGGAALKQEADVAAFARYLDALYVKRARPYKGLTVFPISVVSREFRKSDEDFDVPGRVDGGRGIRINETGKLDSIGLKNRGRLRAVALDGITVRGATQCRAIGAGAVLEPGESVELPASGTKCERSEALEEAGLLPRYTFPAATHRRMIRLESLARKNGDELYTKQHRVWGRLRELFHESGFSGASMDVEDLYRHWSVPVEDYMWRHRIEPLQVGMIAFLGRDMWFMDLFLNTRMLDAVYSQLVRGYAFDAVVRRLGAAGDAAREKGAEFEAAQEVFNYMRSVGYRPMKHNGAALKDSYYFDARRAAGSALINNGQLLQLAAFSKDRAPREY